MPQVTEQRFMEYVRRLLSLRESTALEALPDLMPVLPVVDPAAGEMALNRRERRWGGSFTQAAGGAGQFGQSFLTNPAGSGVLCVVDAFAGYTGGAASGVAAAYITTAAAGSLSGKALDTRGVEPVASFLSLPSICQRGVNLTATPPSSSAFWRWPCPPLVAVVTPTSPTVHRIPIVLRPGTTLVLGNETANEAFTGMFIWRERPTVDELNPTGA